MRERDPMKVQYLCHTPIVFVMTVLFGFTLRTATAEETTPARSTHDYPTVARVEYVNDCIGKTGGKLAALYQCSCAIDRIAGALSYDEFVEATTYAKYAALPGQAGGIFRDSERGRKLAKSFQELEEGALRDCGMTH